MATRDIQTENDAARESEVLDVDADTDNYNKATSSKGTFQQCIHPLHSNPRFPVKLLYLCLGSSLGVLCRYGITVGCSSVLPPAQFPLGTAISNFIGCLIIGVVTGVFKWHIDEFKSTAPCMKLLLVTGFCGSITTFSAFVNDTYILIHSQVNGWGRGSWIAAINIAAVNNTICFIACAVGFELVRIWQTPVEGGALGVNEPDGTTEPSENESVAEEAEILDVDADVESPSS